MCASELCFVLWEMGKTWTGLDWTARKIDVVDCRQLACTRHRHRLEHVKGGGVL